MPNALRTTAAFLATTLVAAVGVWLNLAVQRVEPERWYFPGPLGYEPGVTAPPEKDPPAGPPRGFTSRMFSGGAGAEGAAWEQRNGHTSSVQLMHNLDRVFPAELAAQHPEYFPWVQGRRYLPVAGRPTDAQPDLGREDVARYAAGVARSYFDANPAATSFSLGANDTYIFGDSPETLAVLTRGGLGDGGQMADAGLPALSRSNGRGNPAPDRSPGADPGRASDPALPSDDRSSVLRPLTSSTWPGGWFRGRPDHSPLVFTFMNRAAAELEKTHPDKYLGALAYYWTENTPGFAVHPQVLPFLTADRSQGYDPDFWRQEMDLQERWARTMGIAPRSTGRAGSMSGPSDSVGRNEASNDRGRLIEPTLPSDDNPGRLIEPTLPSDDRGRLGLSAVGLAKADEPTLPVNFGTSTDASIAGPMGRGANSEPKTQNPEPKGKAAPRLGLYDYLDGPGFLIPRIHTRLMAENLRHAWDVGFTDYYAEGDANWGIDGPMHWLVAQLTQDPTQSPERLLEEYYRRLYGPAAAAMRAFFERCEEIWMTQPGNAYWLRYYYNETQAALFPATVRAELRSLLAEAGSKVGLTRQPSPSLRLTSRGDRNGASNESGRGVGAAQTSDNDPGRLIEPTLPSDDRGRLIEPILTADADRGGLTMSALPSGRATNKFAKRVALVSDAFRVTEAFCAFQEARFALTRTVLTGRAETKNPEPQTQNPIPTILRELESYLNAKANFLATLEQVQRKQPLAIAPFDLKYFIEDDPTAAALVALTTAQSSIDSIGGPLSPDGAGPGNARAPEMLAASVTGRDNPPTPKANRGGLTESAQPEAGAIPSQASATIARLRRLSGLPAGWESLFERPLPERSRVEINGNMTGPIRPGRRIAGLEYAVDLPAPWYGHVLPWERHSAKLIPANPSVTAATTPAGDAGRVLRIDGTKYTAVSELVEANGPGLFLVSAEMRGKVSPGGIVMLTLAWVDANQGYLGYSTLRMPAGAWPDWVILRQAGTPPAGARWLAVGARVESQTGDDWLEVRHFSVTK
jgi:hypothetical protein